MTDEIADLTDDEIEAAAAELETAGYEPAPYQDGQGSPAPVAQ